MERRWKVYQVACYLQLLFTGLHSFVSFVGVFQFKHPIYFLLLTIAYGLLFWLAGFGISIYNRLYPDKPVAGKDKRLFNRLFLINFFLSVFLFGLVFAEISTLNDISDILSLSITGLPIPFYIQLIAYILMLIFHFLILYGMYNLRVLLNINSQKKKFEFE